MSNSEKIEKGRQEIEKFRDKKISYESHLEDFFIRKAKEVGALSIKMSPIGNAGFPDVMVFHHGLIWLVELKMPRGSLQENQKRMHETFARHGHKVRVITGEQEILDFIEELKLF